jgi:phycoerythrobilin:ferredoxin oxidoreductase
VDHKNNGEGVYLGLPIFGADIVSLPGNKHLVAIDFQPVLPLVESVGDDGVERISLLPTQYGHFERKLQQIHSKYQSSNADSIPILPWGGDIPPQAMRFFSPYALWTRLGDENAMDTVNTAVWDAFQEYIDLYLELMRAVQDDVNAGKLRIVASTGDNGCENPVWKGHIDYLEYRRTNDPARPMLQRLYGNEWSEKVISEVLFPGL